MSEKKYREIEAEFINLGPTNPSVEGTILSRDSVPFRGGPVGRYLLEREDGSRVKVLGSTQLDDKMREIPDGADVYIAFTGLGQQTDKDKQPMKEFRVFVADPSGDVDATTLPSPATK